MRSPIPVIVLQYGKFELTERCFETLRRQTIPVEIILVDGNSPDATAEQFDRLAKLADRHYFLNENLGYAAANNVAMREILTRHPLPEYFAVLNNDTEVEERCFEELCKAGNAHPEAAQLCPQVSYADGRLQAAGASIYRPLFEPRLRGHLEAPSIYQDEAEVAYAPGMAVLVRSEAARQVGGLPERYFMYGEDVDWSLRFAAHGWKILYAPNAKVCHLESASIGTYNERKAFFLTRASVLLARAWLSPEEFQRIRAAMRTKLVRQSIKYAAHPAYVRGLWKGFKAGMTMDAHG